MSHKLKINKCSISSLCAKPKCTVLHSFPTLRGWIVKPNQKPYLPSSTCPSKPYKSEREIRDGRVTKKIQEVKVKGSGGAIEENPCSFKLAFNVPPKLRSIVGQNPSNWNDKLASSKTTSPLVSFLTLTFSVFDLTPLTSSRATLFNTCLFGYIMNLNNKFGSKRTVIYV